MTTKMFSFTDWFMNRSEDWDCDFLALVVTEDGKVETCPYNSAHDQQQAKMRYPGAVMFGELSRHRGRLENSEDTERLRREDPRTWEVLDNWCKFAERRAA